MSHPKALIIVSVFFLILNLGHAIFSEMAWRNHSQASGALIESIGFSGLTVSSECTATRNPILEPTCACLGDLPGGYCYHLSCGIVGIPVVGEQKDQIGVINQ